MTDWTPIGHRPPLPPIDIAPRHPITPAEEMTMWELAAEHEKERRRRERAEVIWKLVEQTARGTNMPSRQPVEVAPAADTSGMSIAFGTAWKFISGRWVRVDPETGREVGHD